jgi:hypothetical protein
MVFNGMRKTCEISHENASASLDSAAWSTSRSPRTNQSLTTHPDDLVRNLDLPRLEVHLRPQQPEGFADPYTCGEHERRAARADVLTKVSDVEGLRWGGEDYQEFRRALAALESAGVIARVPRSAIRTYAKAARDPCVEVDMGDCMDWMVDPAQDAAG